LESFYLSFLHDGLQVTKAAIQLKIKCLPELCNKALSDYLQQDSSKPFKFNSTQLIALSIVEENARVILNYDANEIAPFRVIELENREDYHCGFPVEINGVPRMLNLYAIIDRVDEVKGQKRIVDYKTGSDKLTFKLEDICTPVSKNLNRAAFQSLLYALVYEQVNGVDNVHPHLYVLRQIQNGSLLLMDREPLEGDLLYEAKTGFKKALNLLLSELFDSEIPFSHNEHSIYCMDGVYSQLCHPSGIANSIEEEIELDLPTR
jgi:ATP-dependent helicase/nuclease subunit B